MKQKPDGGTLIHGTGRLEDLIPAFLDELERLLDEGPQTNIRRHDAHLLNYIQQGVDIPDAFREEANELVHELADALDEYAQEFGYTFSTLEGDASDWGFWPIDWFSLDADEIGIGEEA